MAQKTKGFRGVFGLQHKAPITGAAGVVGQGNAGEVGKFLKNRQTDQGNPLLPGGFGR